MAMAYLLSPVVNWFDRKTLAGINHLRSKKQKEVLSGWSGWLRALSILLTWSVVLLAVYLLMSVLVPQLVESIRTLVAQHKAKAKA